jgi:hypothetical protein
LIVCVVIGAILSHFEKDLPPLSFGLLLVAVATSIIATALHELGHAVGAVASGFKLLMFAVWPFKLIRKERSWTLRWIGRTKLMGFVGVTPVGTHDLRRRLFLMVVAGPCASLLTGIATFVFVAQSSPSWPRWIVAGLWGISFWSLLGVLATMLPSSIQHFATDGQRLRMLFSPGPEAERFGSVLILAGESYSGTRPRGLNPDLIKLLPGPIDGSGDFLISQLIRYNWLLDTDRKEEAGAVLSSLLDQELRSDVREVLQLQMAWFEGRFRQNLAEARRLVETTRIRSRREEGYQCTLLRAQAVIAFLEHRWDDAEKFGHEALHQCDRIADIGAATVIGEGIRQLLGDVLAARSGQQRVVS